MSQDPVQKKRSQREEAESFTAGPGVAASKSQARGSVAGLVIGALLGGFLGFLIGLVVASGSLQLVIVTVVGCVAGLTVGAVVGGFISPRRKLDDAGADT
jgi:F0F1-type ATP synthase assembly protein I